MSPNIWVDDEVYGVLEADARPFVDKEPNDVLRRKLGFDGDAPATPEARHPSGDSAALIPVRPSEPKPRGGKQKPKRTRTRAKKGTLLDENAYWMPILQALQERDGRGAASEVVSRVGELIDSQLLPADRETLETGGLRWQARTQFARLRMKEEGLIEKDSPRGVWEITDKGRQHLAAGNTTAV